MAFERLHGGLLRRKVQNDLFDSGLKALLLDLFRGHGLELFVLFKHLLETNEVDGFGQLSQHLSSRIKIGIVIIGRGLDILDLDLDLLTDVVDVSTGKVVFEAQTAYLVPFLIGEMEEIAELRELLVSHQFHEVFRGGGP